METTFLLAFVFLSNPLHYQRIATGHFCSISEPPSSLAIAGCLLIIFTSPRVVA